jgi:hypothetical protein
VAAQVAALNNVLGENYMKKVILGVLVGFGVLASYGNAFAIECNRAAGERQGFMKDCFCEYDYCVDSEGFYTKMEKSCNYSGVANGKGGDDETEWLD